ncbi:MAG: archaeosortase/exosortase family protein [Crocinitomicaceae bacterium]|nr:archaeosortase/exosortase family protein [Crocinitomicaceae bacterium]
MNSLGTLFKNPIFRFLTLAGGIYFIWLFVYYFLIKVYTDWDYWLDYNIVHLSHYFLQIFGIDTFINLDGSMVMLFVTEGDFRSVTVGDECNGFKLFSIFSIFVIAFPGPWKKKLWFIPLGIIFIHLANVMRVSALMLIQEYHPEYLDFNHLYTFTIFVYGIILLLWYWYIKRFSDYAKKN